MIEEKQPVTVLHWSQEASKILAPLTPQIEMNTTLRGDKKVEPLQPSRERRVERRAMEAIRHMADIDPSDLDNFDEPELPTFVPRVHKRTLKG